MDVVNTTESHTHEQIPLATIFLSYLELGLTAFGFTILQKLKSLVQKNAWLTEDEMNEGLALVQLYPGPMMVDFTAYVGLSTAWGSGRTPGSVGIYSSLICPDDHLICGI